LPTIPIPVILTVHDELLFKVPKAGADDLAALVRETMQSASASIAAGLKCMYRSVVVRS
jgi:DNA polymerase I-like protein with 3'-5' exonuclease and polymerase domains